MTKPLTAGELITILQDFPSYTPLFLYHDPSVGEVNYIVSVSDAYVSLNDSESSSAQHTSPHPDDVPDPEDRIPGTYTYGAIIDGWPVDTTLRTQRIENPQNLHKTYPDINPDSYN